MPRGDQVSRILKVIHILEMAPQGISAREIHSKLEDDGYPCIVRTVYRDLEAVQQAYFPITTTGTGESAKWKLESIASLNRKIQFSYHEMIALFLARESLSVLKGSSLYQHIDSFFSRIEEALGPKVANEMQQLKSYIGFKPAAMWHTGVSQEVLDTIHDACAEGHLLSVSYKAVSGDHKNKIVSHTLGPEGLYFADSGVYLIAKDMESGLHKTYSLARVANAMKLEDPYDSELDDLKDYLREGIGVLRTGEAQDVEIQIDEPLASYISERRWHETQHVTRVPNGIILKLHTRVNDELARWVLGMGPGARVVSPVYLASRVRELAATICSIYQSKAS